MDAAQDWEAVSTVMHAHSGEAGPRADEGGAHASRLALYRQAADVDTLPQLMH